MRRIYFPSSIKNVCGHFFQPGSQHFNYKFKPRLLLCVCIVFAFLRIESQHVCTDRTVNVNPNARLTQMQTHTRRHFTTTV